MAYPKSMYEEYVLMLRAHILLYQLALSNGGTPAEVQVAMMDRRDKLPYTLL